MTPSPAGVTLIKRFETCRLTAYLPTQNDKPTIGWGATGADVRMGMTWTQEQCDDRFAADLDRFAQGVSAALTVETAQNQFDAMTSLAYNIGATAFKASTLLRLHNAGEFERADAQFTVWNKQAGKVLAGLTRRRAAEAAMYRG